jgi:tetratricopeptide (TPR) repeat protein
LEKRFMIARTDTSTAKAGRNDPCPCGSGKKYKTCCLDTARVSPAGVADDVPTLLRRAFEAVARRDMEGTLRGFRAVLAVQPDNPEALAGLGQALCWEERRREGLDYLRRAARLLYREAEWTRDARRILELAEQLHHWGDLDTSLELARLAVRLAPTAPATLNNLALYLLRMNRPEEALPHAEAALRALPGNPACLNLVAQAEAALGRLEAARARFEALIAADREPRQTARALMELAGVLDRLGEYGAAFEAAGQAKAMQREFPEFRQADRERLFRVVERNRAGFNRELLHRWTREDFADDLPAPAFLMGFLRSGTTLTEQVLGAHPGVFTSDENSLVNGLTAELGRISGCPDDTAAGLRRIGLDQARARRRLYWQRVEEEYGQEALSKCFVDKVAMNSIDIGCIATLFPEARVLFALRDPRDVAVSCFMQAFQPAMATANLLTLDGIARQYAATMDLWLHLRDGLPCRWLELRYEDTVENFEPTFRRVFDLLGLEWRPEVEAFHEKAKGRYISTPSFAAVSQPIYRGSVARWRRYAAGLQDILPILEPYIAAFGYADR